MQTNQHVTDNLTDYLNAPNPEYSFLLSGNWGVGKSFFLANFINDYTDKNKHNKIISISLFGFKSTSSIDEEIFKGLHPFLGNKHTKLAGNILKGALKYGLKLDLKGNNDTKNSVNISIDFDKLFFQKSFFRKKTERKIIIALDDFERTNIPLKELLGYVNHLVEFSKLKVILVADEKKLTLADETRKDDIALYRDFKEKVIGKTFEIQHNITEILTFLLKDDRNEILLPHLEVIKKMHMRSDCHNLRLLKQVIENFSNFAKKTERGYFDNIEYTVIFIELFFSFSFEIKIRCLSRKEFINVLNDVTNHNKKYKINNAILYPSETWIEILFNSNCTEFNNITAEFEFFKKTTELPLKTEDTPTWKSLIYYNELEDEEFNELITKIKNSFFSDAEETIFLFFRELDLLLHFSKLGFTNHESESIKEQAKRKIIKILKSKNNERDLLKLTDNYDRSGYSFFSRDDSFFIETFNLAIAKKIEISTREKKKSDQDTVASIIATLEGKNTDVLDELILSKYKFKPLFDNIPSQSLCKIILERENKWQNHFNFLLESRYFSRDTLDGHPPASYMSNELSFWQETKEGLESQIADLRDYKIKKKILTDTTLPLIDRIIARLQ